MRARAALTGLPPIVTALGSNSVPALGFLWADWSVATTMVIYFLECLLLLGLTVVRVLWLTAPGVVFPNSKPSSRRGYLESFLLVGGGFLLVPGLFMAVILFLMLRVPLDLPALGSGVALLTLFQVGGLLADRVTLGQVPGEQAEAWGVHTLGRIFLFYLAIFAGVFAVMWSPLGFLVPFMLLKTIVDVGGQLKLLTQLRLRPR